MEYTLAIDQGTHASRALVLDTRGRVLAESRHPVALHRSGSGHVEQDPEQIVASVQASIHTVLHRLDAKQRASISCCGITTQRSTVLAWRENGTAVSAALNWQDTRGEPQLQTLQCHAAAIRKLSGLPLSPHYGATKLHWLQQLLAGEPGLRYGPLAAFLLQRLIETGSAATDHSNAQRMQLLDIRNLAWSRQLAGWFAVPLERLPPCRPLYHRYGTLAGLDIPVTAMAGDQNAAWFGSGPPADDLAHINIGSGAFVLARQDSDATTGELLESIVWSDGGQCEYLVEGTVNGAGNALAWLQEQRNIDDLQARLAVWLEQVGEPPLFLNTVGGLGSPWWRSGLEPVFRETTEHTADAERAVAVAESILFLLQVNLERIREQRHIRRLRLSGGLSRLDGLCRKLASLSGLEVARSDETEASARGIAWMAAGRPPQREQDTRPELFPPIPDPGLQARYRRFLEHLQSYLRDSHD